MHRFSSSIRPEPQKFSRVLIGPLKCPICGSTFRADYRAGKGWTKSYEYDCCVKNLDKVLRKIEVK